MHLKIPVKPMTFALVKSNERLELRTVVQNLVTLSMILKGYSKQLWHNGVLVRESDLCSRARDRWFKCPPFHCHVTAGQVVHTHVPLSSRTGRKVAVLCGWEGNHRPDQN